MKYLILILIVCLSTFIGIGIGEYFKKREKLFFDIHSFVYSLQLEIDFFEKRLKKIVLEKNDRFGKDFAQILKHFEVFLSSNLDVLNEKELFVGVWILSKEEKAFILSFFSSLGRSSSKTQLASLEQFKSHFYQTYQVAKTESQKNAPMSVKLAFLIGLAIAIILF